MLTSLDRNGEVPEATIIVVTFGLTDDDLDVLRAGAGRMAHKMRFLDVDSAMVEGIDTSAWPKAYPIPVLGRLFLPAAIQEPGARLITLDSDMIVNVSLRPLAVLNMGTDYIAACHDVPRIDDLNYFNSGLMVIDVDRYKGFDVARRAIAWLSDEGLQSRWPDQDALNLVVGHLWHRLDYRWNMHCSPVRALIPEDYEHAYVAHFAATKPWNDVRHLGRFLYVRYLQLFRHRLETFRQVQEHADVTFIFTAYEVLVGSEPDGDEIEALRDVPASVIIRSLTSSPRFAATTLLALKLGIPFVTGTYVSPMTLRHRLWAAARLPVSPDTAQAMTRAADWRTLLEALLADARFVQATGLDWQLTMADAMHEGLSMNRRPTTRELRLAANQDPE